MSDISLPALTDPVVQTAKKRFKRKRRVTLSFEELFTRFSTNEGFSDIAKSIGVTHRTIRDLYNRYFHALFNRKGVERRESYMRQKTEAKIAELARETLSEGVLEIIANAARAAGCVVKVIVRCTRVPHALRKTLSINGQRCDVHTITRGFYPKGCKRVYAPAHLQSRILEKADAIIASVAVDGFEKRLFIIPTPVLREMPVRSTRQGKRFYFPLEKLPVYHNTHSLIDYWQYENAWHLLTHK